MYELRSTDGKKPIVVGTYEEAKAFDELVKSKYKKEIRITPETIPDSFDIELYHSTIVRLATVVLKDGKPQVFLDPDLVILGLDLANFESVDFSSLLQPYIDQNLKLVEQYKAGNTKALNALVGKFLKENKGHDPKEILTKLEEMIKK